MDKIESAHALCFHPTSLKHRNLGILTEAAIITDLCPLVPIKLPNIQSLQKGQKFSKTVLETRSKNIAILSIYSRYLSFLSCCFKLAKPNTVIPDFSSARYPILDDLAAVFKPVPNKVSLYLKSVRKTHSRQDSESSEIFSGKINSNTNSRSNKRPDSESEEEEEELAPLVTKSTRSSEKAWWKGKNNQNGKQEEIVPSDHVDKSTLQMADAIISCSKYAVPKDTTKKRKSKSSKISSTDPLSGDANTILSHTNYSYSQMIDWSQSVDSLEFDKTLTYRQQLSIVEAASKALALLITRLSAFNYREKLFEIASLAMLHPVELVRENIRHALISILKYDLDDSLGGWSTFFIIQAMTSLAQKKQQRIPYPFYDIFCDIPASKLTPTADDAVDLASHLGYENTSRRNIELREAQKRNKTRKKLAKRQTSKRKALLAEEKERETKTQVGIKMNSMQKTIRQKILVALFAGYFRVMDKIVPNSTLFISTLMGLSRFATCIKLDFMFDILGGLANILRLSRGATYSTYDPTLGLELGSNKKRKHKLDHHDEDGIDDPEISKALGDSSLISSASGTTTKKSKKSKPTENVPESLNLDITTKLLVVSVAWHLFSIASEFSISTSDLTEFETFNYLLISELLTTFIVSTGFFPWNPELLGRKFIVSYNDSYSPETTGSLDSNLFLLMSRHPDPEYSYLTEMAAYTTPLTTSIPLLLYNCYSSFLGRKQFSTTRIASFIKRLLLLSTVLPPGSTLAILSFVSQIWKLYPQCAKVLSSDDDSGIGTVGTIAGSEFGNLGDDFFFSPRDTNPDLTPSLSTPVFELELLARSYHPTISAVSDYILMLDSPAASLHVARLGNALPKLFSKYGMLSNQFDWFKWAKTTGCAIIAEYSTFSPSFTGGNNFNWQELVNNAPEDDEPDIPPLPLFSPPISPAPRPQLEARLFKLFSYTINNTIADEDDILTVYPAIPKQYSSFQQSINNILS